MLRRQVHLISQDFAVDLIQLLLQAADVGVVAGDGSCQRGRQYHLQAGAPAICSDTQNVLEKACLMGPAKLALGARSWQCIPWLPYEHAQAACRMHEAQPSSCAQHQTQLLPGLPGHLMSKTVVKSKADVAERVTSSALTSWDTFSASMPPTPFMAGLSQMVLTACHCCHSSGQCLTAMSHCSP